MDFQKHLSKWKQTGELFAAADEQTQGRMQLDAMHPDLREDLQKNAQAIGEKIEFFREILVKERLKSPRLAQILSEKAIEDSILGGWIILSDAMQEFDRYYSLRGGVGGDRFTEFMIEFATTPERLNAIVTFFCFLPHMGGNSGMWKYDQNTGIIEMPTYSDEAWQEDVRERLAATLAVRLLEADGFKNPLEECDRSQVAELTLAILKY